MALVPLRAFVQGSSRSRTLPVFPLAVFGAFAALTLVQLWGLAGWPQSHEFFWFEQRTQIYAQHYSFSDFLPIWSSVDNEGFGSPEPLFYHKLFYMVSASLLGLVGEMKAALVISILLFLMAGALGMYCVLRALGASRDAGVVGGLSLIVANYTVTNWLARGAMAEFSAAMLVPWALLYFLRTVQDERIHPGLAVTLGLVFLGHSVMSFYLLLLFCATLLILMAVRRIRPKILSAKSLLFPGGIFLAMVGPHVLAMAILADEYDMKRIVPERLHPINQFQPLQRYLWDNFWSWGGHWEGYTVQIDTPALALVLAGFLGIFFGGQTTPSNPGKRRAALLPLLPFLVVGALACVLQAPLSAPFYAHFPGAEFIQFPWRLLAIITPIIILLGLYLTDKAFSPRLSGTILALYLITMVVFCGAFVPVDSRLPIQASLAGLTRVQFSAGGEYVPKATSLPIPTKEAVLAGAETAGCHVAPTPASAEVERAQFRIRCARPALLALPVFSSQLHGSVIYYPNGSVRAGRCRAVPAFPGLCGAEVPAGESRVEVEMPDYQAIGRWLASLARQRLATNQAVSRRSDSWIPASMP